MQPTARLRAAYPQLVPFPVHIGEVYGRATSSEGPPMFPVVVLSEQEREVLRLLDSPWGDAGDIEQDLLERLARLHLLHERPGRELGLAVRRALRG